MNTEVEGASANASPRWRGADGGSLSRRFAERQQMPAWIGPAVRWVSKLLLVSALLPLMACSLLLYVVATEGESSPATWISLLVLLAAFLAASVVYLFGPALLLLPVVTPAALLWRRPLRILLLRPFNRATSTSYLRRIARRVLAPLGHIYTLSDRKIRTEWYRRIPFLFGQLQLFAFRSKTLKSARDIERLPKTIARTFRRNLNWFLSKDHIFPLRAKDAVWVSVVEAAIGACDVVVVDLTDRRPAVVTEIALCRRLKSQSDLLFIVNEDQYADARQFLDLRLSAPDAALLGYGESSEALDSFAKQLAMLVGFAEPKRSAWRKAFIGTGFASTTVCCVMVWWYMGAFVTSWLAPGWVAKHSPTFEPVLSVYENAVVNADSETETLAMERLKHDFRLELLFAVRKELAPERFVNANERLRIAWLGIIMSNGVEQDGDLLVSLLRHLLADAVPSDDAYRSAVAVVEAALAIHADPWPYVRRELELANDFRWHRMIDLVRRFSDRGSIPALIVNLDDDSKRSEAAATLAALGAEEAVPALLDQLDQGGFSSSRQGPVRDALKKLVGPSTVPALIAALGDNRSSGRDYAIEALSRQKEHRALPALIRLIPQVREAREAADAIVGAEDLALVCAHIHDNDEARREWANATFARLFAANNRLRCKTLVRARDVTERGQ
jgi:hypothetical protein